MLIIQLGSGANSSGEMAQHSPKRSPEWDQSGKHTDLEYAPMDSTHRAMFESLLRGPHPPLTAVKWQVPRRGWQLEARVVSKKPLAWDQTLALSTTPASTRTAAGVGAKREKRVGS